MVIEGSKGTSAHLKLRAKECAPIVDEIDLWVDAQLGRHSPQSAMGKALTYASNQRSRLRRFIDDAKLALDNNFAERHLRVIALGRKNFLFAGTVEAAQNDAIFQTIVSTCKLNGVNPYEYIKDVLVRISSHKKSLLYELLPWNWQPRVSIGTVAAGT